MADETFHAPCFGDEDFPILLHSNSYSSLNNPNTDHSKIITENKQVLYKSDNSQKESDVSTTEPIISPPEKLDPSDNESNLTTPILRNDTLSTSINQIGQANIMEHDYTLSSESSHFLHQESSSSSSEDSDDNTPLSQMVISMKQTTQKNINEEKLRFSAKKQKTKHPNELQKPVSAYALFFRDTQAAIKGQNSNTTFGEVSKIVASMWESLSNEEKQVYKKKTDAAKKLYQKKLSTLRADLIYKESVNQVKPEQNNKNGFSSNDNITDDSSVMGVFNNREDFQNNQENQEKALSKNQTPQMSLTHTAVYSQPQCLRNGCIKTTVKDKFWDNEYCSSECLVNHCRCVFEAWVTATSQIQQMENN